MPWKIEIHLIVAWAHAGNHHGLSFLFYFDFDRAILELTTKQHRLHLFAGTLVALGRVGRIDADVVAVGWWSQQVEQPLVDPTLGFVFDLGQFFLAHQTDGVLDQFADHALDVATVVAHLGVLGSFDLDKRGSGQSCQTACDLGFADTGGAHHENVLGRDLFAQIFLQLLATPAIADRHGDRPLGVGLAHDVPIELFDDLTGG